MNAVIWRADCPQGHRGATWTQTNGQPATVTACPRCDLNDALSRVAHLIPRPTGATR